MNHSETAFRHLQSVPDSEPETETELKTQPETITNIEQLKKFAGKMVHIKLYGDNDLGEGRLSEDPYFTGKYTFTTPVKLRKTSESAGESYHLIGKRECDQHFEIELVREAPKK